jgi:hypothetical protein
MTSIEKSLCQSCLFVRVVRGRRGQQYLLCRNDAIPEKYPRQPVLACAGYRGVDPPEDAPRNGP